MASIDVGAKSGGRKSVDAVIPLVPFIDLFLCCIMFLLVTAVWNELASINARQNTPGNTVDRLATNDIQLVVSLDAAGFVVATTAGDRHVIPRVGDDLDIAGLCERLDGYRNAYPDERGITVAPDDGIPFEAIIATMDAVRTSGYTTIEL